LVKSAIDLIDGSDSKDVSLLPKEITILPDMQYRYIYQETRTKSGHTSVIVPVLPFAQHYANQGNVNGEKLVLRGLKGAHRTDRANTIDYICLLPKDDAAWKQPVHYAEKDIRTILVKANQVATAKCEVEKKAGEAEKKAIAVPLNSGWVGRIFKSVLGSKIHLQKVEGKWYLINANSFAVQVYLSDPFSGNLIAKDPIKLEQKQATIIDSRMNNLAIKFYTQDSGKGEQIFFISNEEPVCVRSDTPGTVKRSNSKWDKVCRWRTTFDYGCLEPLKSSANHFKVLARSGHLNPPALFLGPYTGKMQCQTLPLLPKLISVPFTEEWIEQVKWFE
jgi:hypothetical protein